MNFRAALVIVFAALALDQAVAPSIPDDEGLGTKVYPGAVAAAALDPAISPSITAEDRISSMVKAYAIAQRQLPPDERETRRHAVAPQRQRKDAKVEPTQECTKHVSADRSKRHSVSVKPRPRKYTESPFLE